MSNSIHITTMKEILKAGDPVDIKCWTKKGTVLEITNCIPLRYNFYKGTRNVKVLASNEIRQVRDSLIFEVNGMTVFM